MTNKTYSVKLVLVERTFQENKFGSYWSPEIERQTQIVESTPDESKARDKFEEIAKLLNMGYVVQ